MREFVDLVFATAPELPEAQNPPEAHLAQYHAFYTQLSRALNLAVNQFPDWESRGATPRRNFRDAVITLPDRAVERYEELFRRLADDFPEVACWANLGSLAEEIREIDVALTTLKGKLADISRGHAPDERRAGLARAYHAGLDESIVESGEVPAGLHVPTLGDAYITPRFRVAGITAKTRPSEESWWADVPVRDTLEDFLIGFLTSPKATVAPLLVLGQPGSGKSVLTRVLAARLPAPDFLALRVVLRDVSAMADLQDQIEYAIRVATGDRLDWPGLVRSAGDALPVVMLDGFDELLQATGVSQTDYLLRVATFQRREADQGRPVAVLVTSRMSVADRARAPEAAVALRLEPFDDAQVTKWLETWNATNAGHFSARGLQRLAPETVLAHRELAEQPLLLLMLALYDADRNALQRASADLGRHDLYEQLLYSFAEREVTQQQPGLSEREMQRVIEDELRRLSVVAFAMFNRGSQWATEADLESDLPALLGAPVPRVPRQDLRAPLRSAEIVLGRFFFIHRARASRDGISLETYEFLHATFGEFLVARLTGQVVQDIAAREAASTMSLTTQPIGDDLLHALLSYTPLSLRASVIGFFTQMVSHFDTERRTDIVDLLIRLFRLAHQPRAAREFDNYRPRPLPVPARHAAYSANLVLLITCVNGNILAGDLFTDEDPISAWRSQALLWRSQLSDEEHTTLVECLTVERFVHGDRRDVRLTLSHGGSDVPPIGPHWTLGRPPPNERHAAVLSAQETQTLRRKAYFECGVYEDVMLHTLEPLETGLAAAITTFVDFQAAHPSAVHALLKVWLSSWDTDTAAECGDAYRTCVRIAISDQLGWDTDTQFRYTASLIDRLSTDGTVPAAVAIDVLTQLVGSGRSTLVDLLASRVVRCMAVLAGRHDGLENQLAQLADSLVAAGAYVVDDDALADVWVTLVAAGAFSTTRAKAVNTRVERTLTARKARLKASLAAIEQATGSFENNPGTLKW